MSFGLCFQHVSVSAFQRLRVSSPSRQAGRAALLASRPLVFGLCFQHVSFSAFQRFRVSSPGRQAGRTALLWDTFLSLGLRFQQCQFFSISVFQLLPGQFQRFSFWLGDSRMLAYIDPGSGLMLLQIIAAAFCGLMLSLKRVRMWIVGLFQRGKK